MPGGSAALEDLEAACAALAESWAGALTMAPADTDADVLAMSDDGLVRVVESLGLLARRLGALQSSCAAAVAARSRRIDAESGLARKHGFATAERLICHANGVRYTDAARLVAVGEATVRRATFSGERLPAAHPHLATALHSGAISVDAADTIRRFLDRIAIRAARDAIEVAEELLVDRAPVVGPDGLPRLIKQLEAHLDPDGVKPREDELRSRRALNIWEDAGGLINLRGAFDPASGAPIKLAIETLVGAELRRAREAKRGAGEPSSGERDGFDTDPVIAEQRTVAQMNADALADIARLSLTSAAAPPALRGAVVVTRIDHDSLASGQGHAMIDGLDQPVSAATAREFAASAGLIPMVLGGAGEVLDLGRAARLFTPAQKLALVERDGGCAWPGCLRPPSHAQAHHLRWWHRDLGPTDLDNGVMLCSHHHHRVHDDGWSVTVRDHRTWFTPPVHLDPEQRPRQGNSPSRHRRVTRAPSTDPPRSVAAAVTIEVTATTRASAAAPSPAAGAERRSVPAA